jgi:hypothetical protein
MKRTNGVLVCRLLITLFGTCLCHFLSPFY